MTPTLIFRAFWEISVKGILTFKFVKLSVMEILAHIEQLKISKKSKIYMHLGEVLPLSGFNEYGYVAQH